VTSGFSARAAFKKVPVRQELGSTMAAMSDRLSGALALMRSSHLMATDSLIL
jgi:hypothetical protein